MFILKGTTRSAKPHGRRYFGHSPELSRTKYARRRRHLTIFRQPHPGQQQLWGDHQLLQPWKAARDTGCGSCGMAGALTQKVLSLTMSRSLETDGRSSGHRQGH